jgi:hypothetical protein
MALFGGHYSAASFLLERGASVTAQNDWNCTAAHWVGMTQQQKNEDVVRKLCLLVQQQGGNFTQTQKQNHTALHKAAQRKNKAVIEWMAQAKEEGGAGLSSEEKELVGRPDDGGHKPSDIWTSAGGDEEFAKWMRDVMKW